MIEQLARWGKIGRNAIRRQISRIDPASAGNSADASIHRHVVAGGVLVGALAFGLGGWASTAEISGALIAQGTLVVAAPPADLSGGRSGGNIRL